MILNADGRNNESILRDGNQLQKGLQSAQDGQAGWLRAASRRWRYVERVGFILAKFLNGFAVVIRGDDQRGFRRIWLAPWPNTIPV